MPSRKNFRSGLTAQNHRAFLLPGGDGQDYTHINRYGPPRQGRYDVDQLPHIAVSCRIHRALPFDYTYFLAQVL